MNDTAEMIRGQMDETKSQLSDKLESLEHQVSETVQSTGSAVNATVGAVQKTVDTVTGAVRDAVHSVSNALDVPRQIDRHPWLALGGAVALGYVAAGFLARAARKSGSPAETTSPCNSCKEDALQETGHAAARSVATGAAVTAAYESGFKRSSWLELRSMANAALIGIAREIVSHAVPPLMNYLTGKSGIAPGASAMVPQSNASTSEAIQKK